MLVNAQKQMSLPFLAFPFLHTVTKSIPAFPLSLARSKNIPSRGDRKHFQERHTKNSAGRDYFSENAMYTGAQFVQNRK